jgi:hypothetical protein
MAEILRSLPLTDRSEDEKSFREVVRAFAEEKIRPLVRRMDEGGGAGGRPEHAV